MGAASPAGAVQILDTRVARVADGYEVDFAVRLDGEAAGLARVILDYPRFAELSPTVTSSRVIGVRGGRGHRKETRIELKFRPCVLVVFCRTVTKVSDASVNDTGRRVVFVTVPSLSDFHEAREVITFEDDAAGDGTGVRFMYSAFLRPKFFVPPFVGVWLVRSYIIKDLTTTSERVERILQRETCVDE